MSETTRPPSLRPRHGSICILPTFLLSCALAAETPLRVEARLLTPISSYSSKAGSEIRALITTPLCFDGGEVPEGAVLRGSLLNVRRVGLGLVREAASIHPEFRDLELLDGRLFPVDARLQSIDNARERIDAKGVIHGIRATAALSNRAGERLIFLAMGHPLAIAPLLIVETGMFHFPDPEIHYRRGTEMYLDVQLPAQWGSVAACLAAPADASQREMDDLRGLVDSLPYWSYSKRQSQPMDLVNLMFVGSSHAVSTAFQAAGWTGSRSNSISAGFGAIRAIAQRGPDDGAPMRTLLLDGAEPAYALQKSLNTFEKRHHLRIWQREGEWRGQQLWASAATQDIGTKFSMRPFGFTHEIENQVDLERDKVVSDLRYTGCVQSVTYVRRPEPIRESGQDYRRGVTTDVRIAVLTLNACEQPRLDLAAGPADPQPSRLVRGFRRVTLTARNHFIRDNWFWRGFEALRLSYEAVRGWERELKEERRARARDLRLLAQQRGARPLVAK
jgi:LssY-like putative type I secretion system component LssY